MFDQSYQWPIVSKNSRVDDDQAVDEAVEAVDVRQGSFDSWLEFLISEDKYY